ncbi:hypothetical protein Ddye_008639 [Dipteronia dyeriana]|uniref:Uncharacterized protein n=1 Tax=Dipteronia dyeriana TaxID=168575 RepID=A0AAE0CLH9_9ROSI|nr:hypothetical protein Ddye_008639 [Dipteronia dyeriana]
MAMTIEASIMLQILACALYSNWWPMLSALMYVVVPMPCLFFGGGSTQFLTSRDGGGARIVSNWFLTFKHPKTGTVTLGGAWDIPPDESGILPVSLS